MLRLVPDPAKKSPNEQQGGTWDAFFWVSDAQALYDEFQSKSAQFVYGPIVQAEYQMKEFAVRDIDGYVQGFGQEWPQQQSANGQWPSMCSDQISSSLYTNNGSRGESAVHSSRLQAQPSNPEIGQITPVFVEDMIW